MFWAQPYYFQFVFCHSNTLSMETLLERTLKCILVARMLNSPFFVSLVVDTEIPVHTCKRYKFISTLETWWSANPSECNKTHPCAQAWVPVNFSSVNSCLLVSFYSPLTVPISWISLCISIRYLERELGLLKTPLCSVYAAPPNHLSPTADDSWECFCILVSYFWLPFSYSPRAIF